MPDPAGCTWLDAQTVTWHSIRRKGTEIPPLKTPLCCLYCISIIFCGSEIGCIDFLFSLINLPPYSLTNEHQEIPNPNGNALPCWIRNYTDEDAHSIVNLVPLAAHAYMQFSWLISLMGNAGLNNVIPLSVHAKMSWSPADLQTGTVKSSSTFPGVQPREGVGEGWREPAKWKTIYILSSVYFYVRLKSAVLVFSALCMAGEHVPVGGMKTDCDVNSKTRSILNLKSG